MRRSLSVSILFCLDVSLLKSQYCNRYEDFANVTAVADNAKARAASCAQHMKPKGLHRLYMKPKGLHCRVKHSTREFSKRTKASVMMLLDDAALRTVSDDGPASFVRSRFGMSVGAHSNAIHPSYLPRYCGTKYSGA